MQTLIHKTDYHGLVRIEKEDITLYKIYNLVTKKARCDVEIKNAGKKVTEESIKRVSGETMQDLDKKFEPSTRVYVKYPANLYKRHLVHIFKKILTKTGFSIRVNQIIVARLMFNAAMQGSIALCEAEVGTGKTHAYLVALLMYRKFNFIENTFKLVGESDDDYITYSYRKPIIISTSSIALQNAIIKDYVPQLSRLLIREDYDPLIKVETAS